MNNPSDGNDGADSEDCKSKLNLYLAQYGIILNQEVTVKSIINVQQAQFQFTVSVPILVIAESHSGEIYTSKKDAEQSAFEAYLTSPSVRTALGVTSSSGGIHISLHWLCIVITVW